MSDGHRTTLGNTGQAVYASCSCGGLVPTERFGYSRIGHAKTDAAAHLDVMRRRAELHAAGFDDSLDVVETTDQGRSALTVRGTSEVHPYSTIGERIAAHERCIVSAHEAMSRIGSSVAWAVFLRMAVRQEPVSTQTDDACPLCDAALPGLLPGPQTAASVSEAFVVSCTGPEEHTFDAYCVVKNGKSRFYLFEAQMAPYDVV